MRWLQECLSCDFKAIIESEKKDAEDTIRSSCLPCGHQGLFTLKRTKLKKIKELK